MSAASIDPKIRLLLQVISCTRKFSSVKAKGFGMKVEEFLSESILDFKDSFQKLQVHLNDSFEYQINVSWKVHTLIFHLYPFLQHNKYGLGVYAEQAGESAHHHHQVWKRYKRRLEHDDYATQLKNSVVEFGKNNLK